MKIEEARKYIACLLLNLKIENTKIDVINDFIKRLKQHTAKCHDASTYDKMCERDEFLKEEIDEFLEKLGGI